MVEPETKLLFDKPKVTFGHATSQSDQLPHPQRDLREGDSLSWQNMNFLWDVDCVGYEDDGKILG